jgi:hypothetical protein
MCHQRGTTTASETSLERSKPQTPWHRDPENPKKPVKVETDAPTRSYAVWQHCLSRPARLAASESELDADP